MFPCFHSRVQTSAHNCFSCLEVRPKVSPGLMSVQFTGSAFRYFPYNLVVDLSTLKDESQGVHWRNRVTNESFELTSAYDKFLNTSSTPSLESTHKFFYYFVSSALLGLQLTLEREFVHFNHDDDGGPSFEDKHLLSVKKVHKSLVPLIRETIQYQNQGRVSSHTIERLLRESSVDQLLHTRTPAIVLADSYGERALSARRRLSLQYAKTEDWWRYFDKWELSLAKFQVRQQGFTVRGNGHLVSRFRDEIKAKASANDNPNSVSAKEPAASTCVGTIHGEGKAHTSTHKAKSKKSHSTRLWKHLTISRDETSASNFLHERLLILFLGREYLGGEQAGHAVSNIQHTEGPSITQQKQQSHSIPIYPRRDTATDQGSSHHMSLQRASLQHSTENRPSLVFQIRKMESGDQGNPKVGVGEGGNRSRALSCQDFQDHQPAGRLKSLESEDHFVNDGREAQYNWKVIHFFASFRGQESDGYLDKPTWTPGFGDDNFTLKAFLPVTNVEGYEKQAGFDFTIHRYYSSESLLPELRRALATKQSPPDPSHHQEKLQLRSQQMREAVHEFLKLHPEFLKSYPSFDIRAPISAPYIFWYLCRSQATLQQLSTSHQDLMRTLTSWIDRNYEDQYAEAKHHFDNGVVTLRTMPFLLCPGDVLVWKEKGKTKAAINSSQAVQTSPPILYWNSSQVLEIENTNHRGIKRGEFSTTWAVDVWSYRFNGEFVRDKRSMNIKFKALSLDQEVEISKLGVYPLRFADEKLKLQLETRGKTFWTCRYRNLVSYTGDQGIFTVCGPCFSEIYTQLTSMEQNGERFMVDFQVYKQLHSDSLKFKLLYEEDSDSDSSDSDSSSDDSSDSGDDSDDGEDDENRRRMSAEDMASETPPSRPYIYLFPDSVPAYNLRSKKWGK